MLTNHCVSFCLWGWQRSLIQSLSYPGSDVFRPWENRRNDGRRDGVHREVLALGPLLNLLMQGQDTAFIQSAMAAGGSGDAVCVYGCICVWWWGIATGWICITFARRLAVGKDTRKEISVESWIWVYNVLPMSGCASEPRYAKPLSNFIPLIADMICSIARGGRGLLLYIQWLLNCGRCPEQVLILRW